MAKKNSGSAGPSEDTGLPALQKRSRDKRDRLIKAGMQAFAEKGYDQTRVSDIADAAGISVGIFYQRFKDKRAFFDALEVEFLQYGQDSWDRFFAGADPDWSSIELFEHLIRGAAQTINRNKGFFRALFTLSHHDRRIVHPAIRLDEYAAVKLENYLIEHHYLPKGKLENNQAYNAISVPSKVLVVMAVADSDDARVNDKELTRELARMMSLYLGLKI